jgi:hypothetical protein
MRFFAEKRHLGCGYLSDDLPKIRNVNAKLAKTGYLEKGMGVNRLASSALNLRVDSQMNAKSPVQLHRALI